LRTSRVQNQVFALNRGYRGYRHKAKASDLGLKPPRFFVFPFKVVNPAVQVAGGWSKVALGHVANAETYLDRWDLIRTFLRIPAPAG
jgi:hypothetical protein